MKWNIFPMSNYHKFWSLFFQNLPKSVSHDVPHNENTSSLKHHTMTHLQLPQLGLNAMSLTYVNELCVFLYDQLQLHINFDKSITYRIEVANQSVSCASYKV